MNEFAFHPEAEVDLIEIWDFIAEDSVDAADRVRDDILGAVVRASIALCWREGRAARRPFRQPHAQKAPLIVLIVRSFGSRVACS
ncbi:MAG TPA: type II toxin-antitoxin system RelE/ParE family toxin [Vicinamibacterales bacterium]|nr:type II toxin-antitoxin system RelE/ParE family toxin [Vicinamibacterales bacterium]